MTLDTGHKYLDIYVNEMVIQYAFTIIIVVVVVVVVIIIIIIIIIMTTIITINIKIEAPLQEDVCVCDVAEKISKHSTLDCYMVL